MKEMLKKFLYSDVACVLVIALLFVVWFVPVFWGFVICGVSMSYGVFRIIMSILDQDVDVHNDANDNVVVVEEKKDDRKPTEWSYISKIDGKEYHISIFKDEISKLYRIADMERHTIFPQVFEDYDDINGWLNTQTNCVLGLVIYSHSNRDKLEEMEREYEKEMNKPLRAKVKDGGYEVELTRDPDDEDHFYVIGENGRTLSDYNRDQLEFFDDETDNT